MKKATLTSLLSCLIFVVCFSQIPVRPQAHSHNDYEQAEPFWLAYRAGFFSIEADVFLEHNNLYVAHDSVELLRHRSLVDLYITPLVASIKKNHGFPYPDKRRSLQILVDIKSDSINTLNNLVKLLYQYPAITKCRKLHWVISGNRPSPELFIRYPAFILFDGELWKSYADQALSKMAMLSDDFKRYSMWRSDSPMTAHDDSVLRTAVAKAHRLNKPVRFWNAPDNQMAWEVLLRLPVDVLNTDHINELQLFLEKKYPVN